MKTSSAGRAAIEQREGRRLSAYRDARGIWTIGVGHAATGRPPKPYAGMTITEAQCDALLAADLAPVEAAIDAAVTVPIGQNEFDALASLGFNIGTGGLRRSSVVRKLNAGDVKGAGAAFMDWCKPAALTGRREKEREHFLTPDPPTAHDPAPAKTVAADRATVLAQRAEQARSKAKTTAVGGGAVAALTAAALTAAARAPVQAAGHHHLAWICLGALAVGAAIDGIVVLVQRQSAATLSGNALEQLATVANHPVPASPPAPIAAAKA